MNNLLSTGTGMALLTAGWLCGGCGDALTGGGYQSRIVEGEITSVDPSHVSARSYVGVLWSDKQSYQLSSDNAPVITDALPTAYRLDLRDAPPESMIMPMSRLASGLTGQVAFGLPAIFDDGNGDGQYAQAIPVYSEEDCLSVARGEPECAVWQQPHDDLRGLGDKTVWFIRDVDQGTLDYLETVGTVDGFKLDGAHNLKPGYNLVKMTCISSGIAMTVVNATTVTITDQAGSPASAGCPIPQS